MVLKGFLDTLSCMVKSYKLLISSTKSQGLLTQIWQIRYFFVPLQSLI